MITKTGCFRDSECTCECGNKHELYGGKGYSTTFCDAHSDGRGGGFYVHEAQCEVCGAISRFEDRGGVKDG